MELRVSYRPRQAIVCYLSAADRPGRERTWRYAGHRHADGRPSHEDHRARRRGGRARFLRGLRDALAARGLGPTGADPASVTVIGNTGDDITLLACACPDLDTLLYTLGGGVNGEQGWGRADEGHLLQGELAAYGVEPQWFGLGDRDLGTHVARLALAGPGRHTQRGDRPPRAARWALGESGFTLRPMSDTPSRRMSSSPMTTGPGRGRCTSRSGGCACARPCQRSASSSPAWTAPRPPPGCSGDPHGRCRPAAPSNPVVSIGVILRGPRGSRRSAWHARPGRGVSPLVGGRPVRGHADACLRAIGVESSSPRSPPCMPTSSTAGSSTRPTATARMPTGWPCSGGPCS